jgi:hypothetical protein
MKGTLSVKKPKLASLRYTFSHLNLVFDKFSYSGFELLSA